MSIKSIVAAFAVAAAGVFSAPAHAVQIEWTLNNGLFDEGGTVSGSFTWDTDFGGSLVSWRFETTSPNADFPATVYQDIAAGNSARVENGDTLIFVDDNGVLDTFNQPRLRELRLGFDATSPALAPGEDAVGLLAIPSADLVLVQTGFASLGLQDISDQGPNFPSRAALAPVGSLLVQQGVVDAPSLSSRVLASPGAAAVPVPAALPMLLGGLGIMGVLARRRRRG